MNWINWETYFEHALQYGMVCMAIALMLSVRIWTTYLLKILFLSHYPEDQEQATENEKLLSRRIIILNAATLLLINVKLVIEVISTFYSGEGHETDWWSYFDNTKSEKFIELAILVVLHVLVGTMISYKLSNNFRDFYQQHRIRLAGATILLILANFFSFIILEESFGDEYAYVDNIWFSVSFYDIPAIVQIVCPRICFHPGERRCRLWRTKPR